MSTKNVSQLDANGYFVRVTEADESPLEPGVWLLPAGTVDQLPQAIPPGMRALWNGAGFDLQPIPEPDPDPEPPPPPTQYQLDVARYARRAGVKDLLIAEMAAENMARVRAGTWTVADLTNLMSDPVLKSVLELVGTLSYELAAQLLATSTHPLLTPEIRAGWVAKLQSHFYLVP